jgi:hypothetical protein
MIAMTMMTMTRFEKELLAKQPQRRRCLAPARKGVSLVQ